MLVVPTPEIKSATTSVVPQIKPQAVMVLPPLSSMVPVNIVVVSSPPKLHPDKMGAVPVPVTSPSTATVADVEPSVQTTLPLNVPAASPLKRT